MSDDLDKDQEVLKERMVKLTHMALDQAEEILKRGSPARKDTLIRSMLGSLSHQLKKSSSEDFSEARLAFERLMAQNRTHGEGEDISAFTPDGLNAVEPDASPPKPYDPN